MSNSAVFLHIRYLKNELLEPIFHKFIYLYSYLFIYYLYDSVIFLQLPVFQFVVFRGMKIEEDCLNFREKINKK